MRNRYGVEYSFKQVEDNVYTIVGDFDKYWRFGGLEGQVNMDFTNLGFVDFSGGPFISVDYDIEGRKITRIYIVDNDIYFEVE